ncbi:hypothetical protein AGMMS50267_03630 [Spirochaetia bacterium]|nr:hypothetical protein AGMMS50267_03630 [Spirochaetia bacterium]
MNNTKVIFFDTETNGVRSTDSVLSISAIKAVYNGNDLETIEDRFTRYYYRNAGEKENPEAIGVNGLTEEVIREKRGDAEYARYFCDDMKSFRRFCTGVRHYAGHNISFDRKFLDFTLKHTFCTMKENTYVLNLKKRNGYAKWPRLSETAAFYQIGLDLTQLHGSDYDTLLTYEVFKKMLAAEKTRDTVLAFLGRR